MEVLLRPCAPCGAALARKDSSTVTKALPYYQYNSGLRYGMLGDGEGQTGDPGSMATWLAHLRAIGSCNRRGITDTAPFLPPFGTNLAGQR